MWLLAQQIMQIKHQRRTTVVPLADLRAAVDEMMTRVNTSVMSRWEAGSTRLDSHDIRWINARLAELQGEHLTPPWPLPDQRSAATHMIWQEYSPELTVTILTDVLRDAITGYRDLVTENFPASDPPWACSASCPYAPTGK
ncbi:hypothetical protein HEP87_64650 [Streptomyces sp. S1D4-11]